jgi:hypothetical protein
MDKAAARKILRSYNPTPKQLIQAFALVDVSVCPFRDPNKFYVLESAKESIYFSLVCTYHPQTPHYIKKSIKFKELLRKL